MEYRRALTPWGSVSQTLLLAAPFWLRKIPTDPHIIADLVLSVRMIGIQNEKVIPEN
jgi:hypothetical protein